MATYQEAYEKSLEYFNGDDLAAKTFVDKYALRDRDGDFKETDPDQMHRRLAKEFARIEAKYENPMSEEEIYNHLKGFKEIVPQGSPMAGIGNPYQIMSLSNCFVLESPLDSYAGILKTDQEEVHLMRRRGGVGFDISNIRPRGMPTNNAAKTTDGIGVFMERFSNTCREVAQNGRRGALLLSVSCHHPEIRTFINIKRDQAKVTGANISIRFTDEFMNAVKNKEKVNLRWPVESDNPEISEWEDAEELWNEVIDAAWHSAEPGLLFWDNAIKYTPSDAYKDFGFGSTSTNPSLRGDERVLTDRGIFRIKDLAEGKVKDFKVKNILGQWHSCVAFKSGENKQLYKIEFTNGDYVYCTPEHKWPVLNTSGNIINPQTGLVKKKRTDELTRGDKFYSPHNTSVIDNKHCEFTRDEGFVLGWNQGDGWLTRHKSQDAYQFGFIFSEEDVAFGIADRVLNWNNTLARRPSTLRQDHGCQAWGFVTTDKAVTSRLFALGACSKKEGIPESIYTGSEEFIKGYVDGLFSADGYVECKENLSDCRLILVSSNEKLVDGFKEILAFYGIKSNKKVSYKEGTFPNGKDHGVKYKRVDLVISGLEAYYFARTFSLSNNTKQDKLDSILGSNNGMYKSDRDYRVVKSVTTTDIYEDVYDITVFDDTHTFQISCGISGNCGEIVLSPRDSCRLLLVNLTGCVENPFTPEARFNFEKFGELVFKSQRLMDDIVDLEVECVDKILDKIKADPEPEYVKRIELDLWEGIKKAALNGRRTGLGVTAVGDTLAQIGIRYGSEESVQMVEEIYKCLAVNSYRSSCTMAKERGAFPVFDHKLEEGHPFLQRIWDANPDVYELYKKYGRRNIANTTTAPAGSVSILTQTTSGIESAFMVAYTRRKKINPTDQEAVADFIDHLGDEWKEFTVYHHGFKQWMEVTGKEKIEDSPYHKATANDLDWETSVRLQAAAQKWVCHSISRTCNIPNDAPKELVSKIYKAAWESGCKGFTVYRDGCRTGVLVASKEKEAEDGRPVNIERNHAPRRPDVLPCDIYRGTVYGDPWTIVVGLLDGEPYELFGGPSKEAGIPKSVKEGFMKKVKVSKRRNRYDLCFKFNNDERCIPDVGNLFENKDYGMFTRTLSLALRHGAPVQHLVEQLHKDESDNLFSLSAVLRRALKKYVVDGAIVSGFKRGCEKCGSTNMVFQEGCPACIDCGFQKCS